MIFPKHDMYGHEIWPLGETGWGMSVSFHKEPQSELPTKLHPNFTLFHYSDPNPQQCLLTLTLHGIEGRPQVQNIFDGRIEEVETATE